MKSKLSRKALCLNCGKYTRYFIGIRNNSLTTINYNERIAFCKVCHREVDVPGLWDINLETLNIAKGIKVENKYGK